MYLELSNGLIHNRRDQSIQNSISNGVEIEDRPTIATDKEIFNSIQSNQDGLDELTYRKK